jgi:hypothetical protein
MPAILLGSVEYMQINTRRQPFAAHGTLPGAFTWIGIGVTVHPDARMCSMEPLLRVLVRTRILLSAFFPYSYDCAVSMHAGNFATSRRSWTMKTCSLNFRRAVIFGTVATLSFLSLSIALAQQSDPQTVSATATLLLSPTEQAEQNGTALHISLKDLTKLALQNNLDTAISDTNEELLQQEARAIMANRQVDMRG